MSNGTDLGKFRQLDEILYIDGYPGYQHLMHAGNHMELICEVKELHIIDGSPQLIFVRSNYTIEPIFVPPLNATPEPHATNPGLNQVPASYFGALKHQEDQSHSVLTSDIDSQSEQFVSSLIKNPVDGNIPNDVPARQNSLGLWKYLDDGSPCLRDNPNSAIQSLHPVTNKRLFTITEISP